MDKSKPFVITISRQIGSGGAYIGQQLAKSLNIYYADHEIISNAAKQLSVLEEDLEAKDEKLQSWWNSFVQLSVFASGSYVPPKMIVPTSRELFQVESQIIKRIAKEHSAVIIGKCGFHVLQKHPNRLSLFLHGDIDFRKDRIKELYNVSDQAALDMITQNDKERTLYIETFTGRKWNDARQYDLAIDTGKLGVDKSVALILDYLKLRQSAD
jgi:cytidylate kinase